MNRGAGPGYDLHVLSDGAGELEAGLATAGVTKCSPDDLERRRVLAGLPDAHADGFLGLLPQECGLEEAVSYRKGCYIGQEIMARLEARGNTRQHVVQVRADGPLETGTELKVGGRVVGRVGKPVLAEGIWTALAVVRKDIPDGAALDAGATTARLSLLPSG